MIRAISAAVVAFVCLNAAMTAPAFARKNTQSVVTVFDNDGRARMPGFAAPQARSHETEAASRRGRRAAASTPVYGMARDTHGMVHDGDVRGATIIGGRPAGCPRQYCGCGTSLKVFGRIRPELNLAANWLRKFPRTAPAPNMAAARPGHVMLLLAHVGGDKWKVYDANSGGGLTRIWVRSIRGFAVVNPHASSPGVAVASSSEARVTMANN